MDNNLGEFDKVAQEFIYKMQGKHIPRSVQFLKKLKLRNGMKKVLEDLTNLGYKGVITTSKSTQAEAVVRGALERTGIESYFSGIYSSDKTQKFPGSGKNYLDVAKDFELTYGKISENMIVVGDSQKDQP